MKKSLPLLALAAFLLTSCGGPSADDFRRIDPQGHTACVHFGSGYADEGNLGRTNMAKAAEHGAASTTGQIRTAVATDESGNAVITDRHAFKKACEDQGITFK